MPGKLKKLAMPKREEMDISELEMDMPAEGGGEEMAAEGEGEDMPVEAGPLADVSDEELMAELKKRGLSKRLAEESPEEQAMDAELGAEEMENEEEEYV